MPIRASTARISAGARKRCSAFTAGPALYGSDSIGALVTIYPRRCIALCEREIHLGRIGGSVVVDRRPAVIPPDCVPIWLFGALQK